MGTTYETDVVAWANEQAALLRAGKLSAIDIEHIAEEVEDVGKSEQRELACRMAVLLAHLLKWQTQVSRRSVSWEKTIKDQRRMIERRLTKMPSLKISLNDVEWLEDVWTDARNQAEKETGLDYAEFPETLPWTIGNVLSPDWLP